VESVHKSSDSDTDSDSSIFKTSDSDSSIFKTSDSDSSIFKTSDSDSSIFKTPTPTPTPQPWFEQLYEAYGGMALYVGCRRKKTDTSFAWYKVLVAAGIA
jgi:hypothetical protein